MSWLIKFLFGFMKPFLLWLEPAFTGADGKASYRKLSAFFLMIMISSCTSKLLLKDTVELYHIYILAILVATFLLLVGIITVPMIVDIWKNGRHASNAVNPPSA